MFHGEGSGAAAPDRHAEPAARCGQQDHADSEMSRLHALQPGDVVRVTLRRFDPVCDAEPVYETFEVPYTPRMRVLDALHHLYEEQGQDFGYRWYCGTKKCGTCAVRVNGRETLACWEPAAAQMTIEPLRHLPVVRDLVVDRAPFERKLVGLRTWIDRAAPYKTFPEPVAGTATAAMRPAMDCISCMACYSACPVLDFESEIPFAGPAPLVHLARVALDPRDSGARAATLAKETNIFHCVSCYKCEEVCPAHIPIVSRAIEPLKRQALAAARGDEARHATAFLEVVRRRGRIEPTLLVAKVRGLRVLRNWPQALRMLVRGKIRPWRALWGRAIPGVEALRGYFNGGQ